jgi:hypothetical protein
MAVAQVKMISCHLIVEVRPRYYNLPIPAARNGAMLFPQVLHCLPLWHRSICITANVAYCVPHLSSVLRRDICKRKRLFMAVNCG